ncbi:MAG: hypothetical protein ACYS6K_27300 [Planctomycetota bacterium]|jgi:hypothetical protein
MKVKKYLFISAAVTMSICAVVLSRSDKSIDAWTRPTPMAAIKALYGVYSVSVYVEIRANGSYDSDYKGVLSRYNLSSSIRQQLKEETNVVLLESDSCADGRIWAEIQITTREETEFAAANITVSFVDRIESCVVKDFHLDGTTWQSQATLLVHKDELSEEVSKCVRVLVGNFCRIFRGKQEFEKSYEKSRKEFQ